MPANSPLSPAAVDMGFGQDLQQQVADETDEEKRKRRLGLSQMQSEASSMLLGTGYGGLGAAGVGKV